MRIELEDPFEFFQLLADMHRNVEDQTRAQMWFLKHRCSHCGKPLMKPMQCSSCKAAFYCDRDCQMRDYKAKHRAECASFAHPPLADAFLTEPLDGELHAQAPVFAHDHRERVGCWVSTEFCVDATLTPLFAPFPVATMDMLSDTTLAMDYSGKVLQFLKANPGSMERFLDGGPPRDVLTLTFLVQNRRKDQKSILVFGSRVQLVVSADTNSATTAGMPAVGLSETRPDQSNGLAVVNVAEDMLTKDPRLVISTITGVEVKPEKAIPSSVHDVKKGIVSLKPGEFVTFACQFRVGDCDKIKTELQALLRLACIIVPFTVWDGLSDPMAEDCSLARSQARGEYASGFRMQVDRAAVNAHYNDYIVKGPYAYSCNYFGKERTDAYRDMVQLGQALHIM